MMHPMRMTNKQVQEMITSLRKQLKAAKTATGTIALEYKLTTEATNKATLVITDKAWKKIKALVDECDKEIAWHGTISKNHNTYTIEDVYVFPQTVTAATVTSDETAYSTWLMSQPDDVFNNLRFHGHSHVNMGVSPSGVDMEYQKNIIKNLNDFYIFTIFNKKGAHWCTIYDVTDNLVYDNEDIILLTTDTAATEWAKEQIKQQVVIQKPVKPKATLTKSTDKLESLSDQIVSQYYDKTGKRKSQEQIEREVEEDDYFHGYGYGGYYYGQK